MASAHPTFPIEAGDILSRPAVNIPTIRRQDTGDLTHPDNDMATVRRHDDDIDEAEERREFRMAMTAMAQAATQNGNGKTSRQYLPAWLASSAAVAALLVTVSGSKWTNSSEADLRRDIAVLTEKLTANEERQKERERIADRERALLDERYRQMSIALEARGIKLPVQ